MWRTAPPRSRCHSPDPGPRPSRKKAFVLTRAATLTEPSSLRIAAIPAAELSQVPRALAPGGRSPHFSLAGGPERARRARPWQTLCRDLSFRTPNARAHRRRQERNPSRACLVSAFSFFAHVAPTSPVTDSYRVSPPGESQRSSGFSRLRTAKASGVFAARFSRARKSTTATGGPQLPQSLAVFRADYEE